MPLLVLSLGGVISYLIQSRELIEAKRVRDEDARTSQQALGRSFFFKKLNAHSNFANFDKHFTDSASALGPGAKSLEP